MYKKLEQDLDLAGNINDAQVLKSFHKTGKGEYGEGDVFLGVKVGKQREIIQKYLDLSLGDLRKLLHTNIHEYRFSALLILLYQYQNRDKEKIYNFYLHNLKYINAWDLVDLSAPKIMGDYIWHHKKEKKILNSLISSSDLWLRRIALVATLYFIKQGLYQETIRLAKKVLDDKRDLTQKAMGWMLREVGKREEKILLDFLDQYSSQMGRTALRYAIERLGEKRKYYLNK